MIKEHQRLKRRLEEVQSPDYVMNLKKAIKQSEVDMKEHETSIKKMNVD